MKWLHINGKRFKEYIPYIDTLILPVGSIEIHGGHLPLGTDTLIVKRLGEIIEEKLTGRVFLLPEVAYGRTLGLPMEGAVDIPESVFMEYVYYAVQGYRQWGLKNIILLNGHERNIPALLQVRERFIKDGWNAWLSNWWMDYERVIRPIASDCAHGGDGETSVMLAIDSRHVDMEPGMEDSYASGGKVIWGDAVKATQGKGEAILHEVGKQMIEDVISLWK